LGLIGFVLSLPEGGFIVIYLFIIDTYVHLGIRQIGFVLHKIGAICRGFSTDVENRRQKTEDRTQTIDDKFLLHKELSGSLKSEIQISKSETNSKYKCSNDQNGERAITIIDYLLLIPHEADFRCA